ncbi:GNAT family N-acetyltransferase [Sulfurivermis fontis]|uniref:GNAT family N-acetyltransferase n=1 Tax=Sulfurivermis fontis TaxID=1972068 RepID=UPI000FDC3232|nr:GNAT family N-acetyltransferase [Sulfurivermis fontis]
MACRVRPATAGDLPALCALLGELFSIEADFQPDPARQWVALERLLQRPQQALVLVAEDGGAVCGMCTAQVLISTAEGGEAALVEDVVVRHDRRGSGIGSALLDALEAWCGARGITRLQLLADTANAPALAFYRRRGWQTTQLQAWRKYPAASSAQ